MRMKLFLLAGLVVVSGLFFANTTARGQTDNFLASAEKAMKAWDAGDFDEAGFQYFLFQFRRLIDTALFPPLEEIDARGIDLKALASRYDLAIIAAVVRDRERLGRVVDRLEKFDLSVPEDHDFGWKTPTSFNPADYSEKARAALPVWLEKYKALNSLQANDEFYVIWRQIQEFNLDEKLIRTIDGDTWKATRKLNQVQLNAATVRMNEIAAESRIDWNEIASNSQTKIEIILGVNEMPTQETVVGEYNKLNSAEREVLLDKGTESAGVGAYTDNKSSGMYLCRRCNAALYRSNDKFDSHCGWPSFDSEIPGTVLRLPDADGMRIEIVCNNCSGHLGHVFEGEGYTEKNTRHCVNSISMKFIPAGEKLPPKITRDKK